MRIPQYHIPRTSAEAVNDPMAMQLLEEIITVLVEEICCLSKPYGVLSFLSRTHAPRGKRVPLESGKRE
jgi:hypothetical protein